MLAPGGEAGAESLWARHMVESLEMYPAFVAELESATGLAIDFRICGAYEYASNAQHWDDLVERAERQRTLGIESRVENQRLYYPGDGQVKPSHVVRALVEAGRKLGVAFVENLPVKMIEAGKVFTESGEFSA